MNEDFELVRGTGNVFRDLGKDNADLLQIKALLAAAIIKQMDKDGLTVRKAQTITGMPAADFSRIRSADLSRFTVDRLIRVLGHLGPRVELQIKPKRKLRSSAPQLAHA